MSISTVLGSTSSASLMTHRDLLTMSLMLRSSSPIMRETSRIGTTMLTVALISPLSL